jgi:Zn-dependent peptidase ImmA (M78 family)
LELGVRVYIRRLEANISGLFAYDDKIGACMLFNANHPRERRTLTAAHETGHLVSTRRQPEVLTDNRGENSREERYAAAFSAAFLMPARAVMQKFKEVTAGAEKLTRRHVIVLAHAFGVSREATVRRLEDLKLAPKGTWDRRARFSATWPRPIQARRMATGRPVSGWGCSPMLSPAGAY